MSAHVMMSKNNNVDCNDRMRWLSGYIGYTDPSIHIDVVFLCLFDFIDGCYGILTITSWKRELHLWAPLGHFCLLWPAADFSLHVTFFPCIFFPLSATKQMWKPDSFSKSCCIHYQLNPGDPYQITKPNNALFKIKKLIIQRYTKMMAIMWIYSSRWEARAYLCPRFLSVILSSQQIRRNIHGITLSMSIAVLQMVAKHAPCKLKRGSSKHAVFFQAFPWCQSKGIKIFDVVPLAWSFIFSSFYTKLHT